MFDFGYGTECLHNKKYFGRPALKKQVHENNANVAAAASEQYLEIKI